MSVQFVLLLEDNHIQVKLLTDILKYNGLKVVATASKDEALSLALDNPILIISDICLEEDDTTGKIINRDGIEFAKELKNNPKTAHIPVILRSSISLSDFGVTLSETKANSFIPKNSNIEQFVELVNQFIEKA